MKFIIFFAGTFCWCTSIALARPVAQDGPSDIEPPIEPIQRIRPIQRLRPISRIASSSDADGPDVPRFAKFLDGSAIVELPIETPSNGTASTNGTLGERSGQEYIVLFNEGKTTPPRLSSVLSKVGYSFDTPDLSHVFDNSAFRGFSGPMSQDSADKLNGMDDFTVEPVVTIRGDMQRTRSGGPWNLERISQERTVKGNVRGLDFTYKFDDMGQLGKGVDIYVLDTGLNIDHEAFGGRARMGFSKDGPEDLNAASDQNGHGTHAAGTAAADILGVASGANIIGVKIMGRDRQGTTADAVKGLDWVVQQHDKRKSEPGFVGSIASISWNAAKRVQHLDRAIDAAVDRGVHVSMAAGNDAKNACEFSPAARGGQGDDGKGGKAVTVGSTNTDDRISSFSNIGPCVDVYAPGESIISTWIGGSKALEIQAGTSMACPLVSGLMAYMMSRNPRLAASPPEMKAALRDTSIQPGIVKKGRSGIVAAGSFRLVNNGVDIVGNTR
ncbi:MAG: hypothetical protein M1823_003531 [Watsoniomyces obsoletus]|nr:MAG: hypothetical protein M1823_003531 [Watsoniomyces obsoletus]